MSDSLNEFAVSLPVVSVAPLAATAPTYGDNPVSCDATANYSLPAEVNSAESGHINVWLDGTPIVNDVPGASTVFTDLVLNVSIRNPETGNCCTYKMVKRISLDKCKLAHQAELLTPFQVLEAEEDPAEVEKYMAEFHAVRRAREVAGIMESDGKEKAKVLFSYEDEMENGTPSTSTATVTISAIKDKAHARHVFNLKYAPKYKNAKITRVTMISDKE